MDRPIRDKRRYSSATRSPASGGLPLGERVEITFRPAFPVPAVGGLLELRSDPARYPWDPHEPLALRIAGCDFSSRDIERWKVI